MLDITVLMSTGPSICQKPEVQEPCYKCPVANVVPQHRVDHSTGLPCLICNALLSCATSVNFGVVSWQRGTAAQVSSNIALFWA